MSGTAVRITGCTGSYVYKRKLAGGGWGEVQGGSMRFQYFISLRTAFFYVDLKRVKYFLNQYRYTSLNDGDTL